MKKKKLIIAITTIIIIIAALVVVAISYPKSIDETTANSITATDDGVSQQEKETVPSKYDEYYNKNNDFVGWIKIDGTHVDYPVVQTDNNKYYLNHNFEKKSEDRGSIFMASDCNSKNLDTNTVIHGHNWLDKTMFSELTKYSNFKFYKKHPVIEFNTKTDMYKWKIYSVFITTGSKNEDNGYMFNYVYPHMEGKNFDGYIKELNARSLYNTGVDVNENDKFLTLSTCTREVDSKNYRTDCRIVIVARLVRAGESATVDTTVAKENKNPKYPQIWYDQNKKENPYVDEPKWYPYELD